jgi:hypothetical protein
MEDLLTCGICLDHFNTTTKVPLSLICGHTFCKPCLTLISPKAKGVICPLDSSIDPREVSSIPKNYSLIEIISLTSSKSSLISDHRRQIETCKETLLSLSKAKTFSDSQKSSSIQALTDSFNSLREMINYRESELLSQITSTHDLIDSKLSEASSSLSLSLSTQESILTRLLETPEISEKPLKLDLSKSSEILKITEKLPIKLFCSLEKIEEAIQSSTKLVDNTNSKVSSLSGKFICDVRVKEKARFLPKSTFVKTWRVRNEGLEAWPNDCWCVFSHGEFSGEKVVVDPAWPGEEIDVSVLLVAPVEVGVHRSFWQLLDPTGCTFGPTLSAEIEVYNVD